MKINLVRTKRLRDAEIRKVFDVLYTHAGPMEFILQRTPILFEENNFVWEKLFSLMEQYRQEQNISEDNYLVCITELNNELNWFSACDPEGSNNIFIGAKDWQYFIYAEEHFPVAFEVIINILEKILFQLFDENNQLSFVHQNPVGCINDFCGFKPDISFKMRTADICRDCL